MPVLIVVVSLTVGGGLLARELYQTPSTAEPAVANDPAPPPLRPQQQPGPPTVELASDAAAHPEAEPVRDLLQRHFDSINAGDYDRWSNTVVAERVQAQPRKEWQKNYQTTRDGSIRVFRLEAAPENTLTALIGFTSTQDASDGPPDLQEPCIIWRLAFPLTQVGGEWKIDAVTTGTIPEREAC
ncbi:hypothetical protein JHE00_20440 [Prauserella sp. ASG 168]|uniref:Uncharacterized protein n=1 Tax=Prauserella cavernicola TaxID=2800127 RepID=A0A934V5N7_9PSEU|nr:hypothetical protein [Prauserella cavernicola]